LFDAVFEGLFNDDPVVRMRAADAIEKVSAQHPEFLKPYKAVLLEQIAGLEQQEIRWHVAQMIPRLELDQAERVRATEILFRYLEDKSNIVKAFSMQALADLAARDERLVPRVTAMLEELVQTGSPAVKARGRKLLARRPSISRKKAT
jgi:hypothetical protein